MKNSQNTTDHANKGLEYKSRSTIDVFEMPRKEM